MSTRTHIRAVMCVALGAIAITPATASASDAISITQWNKVAQRTAISVARQFQAQSMVHTAYVQAAVYDAVVAIEGGYAPYGPPLDPRPGASVDAAVAVAAHDALVAYFPSQQSTLDADLANALDAIGDGTEKERGIDVGRQAAAQLLTLRANDGRDWCCFQQPAPAAGAWEPPPGQSPQTPWLAHLRPLMLDRADQFRLGPPPELGSADWAANYDEVRRLGARDSQERTAEQTTIARFWSTNAVVQYNAAFEEITRQRSLSAVDAARLYAMGNMVGADALIACLDSKYHHLFWRPMYAVPRGDEDGNPLTVGDPAWVPLLATPNHPEYPAAHGCLTAAEAEVLSHFLGTNRIELDLTSTVTASMPRRHYDTVSELVREIVDARVWGGLHYRVSGVHGVVLGRKVARWSLARFFGA